MDKCSRTTVSLLNYSRFGEWRDG